MSLSQEEFRQIRKDRDDARGRLRRTMTITHSGMTRRLEADQLIASGDRARMAERIYSLRLENLKEEFCQIRRDRDNARGRLRSDGNSGNRNGGNGNSRNENPDENVRGARPVARECTYQDFMKCQPLNLNGTEGVIGLIKYALTWWNSHKRTIGTEAAFAMSWGELTKLMTEVYCPRNEI
ncbi:hypothetical protein Tco_0321911 [Tanacetum coccineum]